MYKVDIGEFDGKSWEEIIQRCLKDKYEDEIYQRMPSKVSGDNGIEGFTLRTGKVFQCYCPESQYSAKELYENQRDKITTDLKKLVTYEKEIVKALGGKQVTEWHFVTPEFTNKALNAHCRTKEIEYRALNLKHLDPDFKVVIKEYTDYIKEITRHMNLMDLKIDITYNKPIKVNWSECDSQHIENLNRKMMKLFDVNDDSEIEKKESVDKVVESFILFYQRGLKIINTLENDFPNQYEKYLRVKSSQDEDIELECLISPKPKQILFKDIQKELTSTLIDELGKWFETPGIEQLAKKIIAEWLMLCPLNFGGE